MAARRKRLLRRVVKALIAVIVVAVVTGAVAVAVALYTPWGREKVRAEAEAQLAAAFVGGATIGELDIGWRGDVTAHDVVIRAPDGTTAIAIGTVTGRVALLPLLDHEVDVAYLGAEDVTVTVARGPDGKIGLADVLAPGPPSPWRVWVPRAKVHGGAVVVTGFTREPLHLDDIAGDAVADIPFGGAVFVTAIGTARWREHGAAVEVAGTLQHDDDGWRFPVLAGEVGDVGIAAAVATYVSDADGDVPAVSGLFAAAGSGAALARLGVPASGAAAGAAHVVVRGGPSDEHAVVVGTVAGAAVRAEVDANLVAWRVRGDARIASELDLAALPGGARGRVTGAVAFEVDAAHGAPVVAVRGHVAGRELRYAGGRAGTLELELDATGLPARPRGRAQLELRDITRGSVALDSFDITAASGAGNEVNVSARTKPKDRPWLFEADARVVPGHDAVPTAIDLVRHHVRIAGEDWRGTAGHIAVGDGGVAVRGFTSASRDGTIALDGEYARGRLRVDTQVTVPKVATGRARLDIEGDTVRAADVAVDADVGAVAELLGVSSAPQGHATLRVSVARPGAVAATLDANLTNILSRSVAVHADAALDDRGARVDARVADIATLHGTLATSLAQLVADPRTALAAALSATVTLPATPAARLLSELGSTAVVEGALSGTVEGTLTVAGTLAHPTATGKLLARDLAAPIPGRETAPSLARTITADAAYDGHDVHATLVAVGDGGTLRATATAPVASLDHAGASVTVVAEHFEIHPIAAMFPGALAGIAGTLDGKLTATGLGTRPDALQAPQLAGSLTLRNARIPVAPQLGTLRDATVAITIADGHANVTVDGKLRAGTVSVKGTLPLAEVSGHAVIQLHHISPIASVEPALDAEVVADLRRTDDRYEVALTVQNGVITIPDERNHPLDAVGLPEDFTLAAPPAQPVAPLPRKPAPPAGKLASKTPAPVAKPPPTHPTLICTIDFGHTRVVASDLHTEITGKLELSIGAATTNTAGIGVVGQVAASRGDALLFGRRYQIEHAYARFDGTTDPAVDARITYDFPDVTTITELHGRLSKPQLVMRSDPTSYTQDQLLGFLLGGEPNSDPAESQATASQVSSTGMSAVAGKMSGYFKKALPISIDVLDYEQATAQNSAALRVGTWLTRDLFIAYRRHLDPRPDENESEADSEYWLNSHVSIEAEAGDRDYDGVDLLWRHRW